MSLQKLYKVQQPSFDNVLIAKDAVWRIDSVVGNKNCISLNVSVYKDETVSCVIDRQSFDFISSVQSDAKNIFAQGYEYLKTLPEFSDSIDC
jgi:hypothetical protein